jgi:hypothetical protein
MMASNVTTTKQRVGKAEAAPADPNYRSIRIALPIELLEEVER